jgi:hypothetical protein
MASDVAFFDLISMQIDERLQWIDCWLAQVDVPCRS